MTDTRAKLIAAGVLVCAAVVSVSFGPQPDPPLVSAGTPVSSVDQIAVPASTTEASSEGISDAQQEEMNKIVREAFEELHAAVVLNVGDEALAEYVLGPLEKKCPFYVPSGVEYRDCLSRLIEREKAILKGSSKDIAQAEAYCESISAEYTGMEGANLSLSCLAYKLK